MKSQILVMVILFLPTTPSLAQHSIATDVLVIGGGTGGTAAAIESAKKGSRTMLIEPTHMLGGMLTAAGVSCTDGNDSLAGGFWKSFRDALHAHYKTSNLATGWVSETCFEPHVADSIFKAWVYQQKKLSVMYGWTFVKVTKQSNRVTGAQFMNGSGQIMNITANVTIDATELGDVLANAGAAFDIGTEDAADSKEAMAPGKTDIIQDITWAAVLKDYGAGSDKTIPMPAGYRAEEYYCSCTSAPCNGTAYKTDAAGMLDYGKLPNNKYMLNWPAHGNDAYLNVINLSPAERATEYASAKTHTLGFVYFIQTVLGYKQIGLAEDELDHGLAVIPYNREGRRVVGMVRFNVNDITDPFSQTDALFRTGVACGDYPVDHHHGQNPATPSIAFPKIPSFNLPLGVMIPVAVDGLIVCEKGISVSNIVNGATRLQPIVMLAGQAAGALAAWSVKNGRQPRKADIRSIQTDLLQEKAYLAPYIDVRYEDPAWGSIQRVGLTGILRGTGKPSGWANKTYFYPDSLVDPIEFFRDFKSFGDPEWKFDQRRYLTQEAACSFLFAYLTGRHNRNAMPASRAWVASGLTDYAPQKAITRKELAILLDRYARIFHERKVDFRGNIIPSGH